MSRVISRCFGVDLLKGPFGIKIKYWWIFLLTIACLLATLGYAMVLIGLTMVMIVCFVGLKIPVLAVAVCLSVSMMVMYLSARRAVHYWRLIYGPWFTGVTFPIRNVKCPEIKLEDMVNVQRLDKIGAEFYQWDEPLIKDPDYKDGSVTGPDGDTFAGSGL